MSLSRQKTLCITLGFMICLPVVAHAQSTRDRGRDDRRDRTIRFSIERRDRAPDREVTMSVGAYRSQDDDKNLPMASLRTDWRLRRWLRSELGASYAIGSIATPGGGLIAPPDQTLQIASATVGIRAELPTQFIRPFLGVAAGLAYRNEEKGTSYVRTTMAFPAGLRFVLSDRVSLRAEARFRFDQRRTGGEAVGVEQTGGLSVVF